MKTPDLTRAQILALVKNAVAVAVAFGLPLSSSERIAILALAGSLGIVLMGADAMIRRARAQHLAGPLTDLAAAKAISAAQARVSARGPRHFQDKLDREAAAEEAATAANAGIDPAAPPGIDPAAPTV